MKKITLLFICLLSLYNFKMYSQVQKNPVNWFASYKTISATEGEIIITGIIEKGWHTYSQKPTDAGPISTVLTFSKSKDYTLIGAAEESGAVEEYEKTFEAKVSSFSNKAEFRQKVKLNGKGGFTIPIKVEFVCCNDNMCLPGKIAELSVKTQ